MRRHGVGIGGGGRGRDGTDEYIYTWALYTELVLCRDCIALYFFLVCLDIDGVYQTIPMNNHCPIIQSIF